MTERKRGTKQCKYGECGLVWTARQDTNPKICARCASVRGGKAGKGRLRVGRKPCAQCGAPIRETLPDVHCSVACRVAATSIDRTCKTCGAGFKLPRSILSGKTNSAGNFCSRPCYETWLCRTDRITGRGSQWRARRSAAIRAFPHCALCGTRERLTVPVLPFSRIDELGAGMYRGEKITRAKKHDAGHPPAVGGAVPTRALHSPGEAA